MGCRRSGHLDESDDMAHRGDRRRHAADNLVRPDAGRGDSSDNLAHGRSGRDNESDNLGRRSDHHSHQGSDVGGPHRGRDVAGNDMADIRLSLHEPIYDMGGLSIRHCHASDNLGHPRTGGVHPGDDMVRPDAGLDGEGNHMDDQCAGLHDPCGDVDHTHRCHLDQGRDMGNSPVRRDVSCNHVGGCRRSCRCINAASDDLGHGVSCHLVHGDQLGDRSRRRLDQSNDVGDTPGRHSAQSDHVDRQSQRRR